MAQALGYLDEEVANGVFRLLDEQRKKLEQAIKIADDFKANAGKPRPVIAAQVDETELSKQVEKDEKELAELEKQVIEGKAALQQLRTDIDAKKGNPPKASLPARAVVEDPGAQKWLDENMGGIQKSIADQGAKLQAILAEIEKCEQGVSNLTKLRTRRVKVQNDIKFQRTALGAINDRITQLKEELASL